MIIRPTRPAIIAPTVSPIVEGGALPWDPRSASRGTSAPAFTPADIAGLEAWYRETYAAGTWTDLSGNGRNLVQATAGSRPSQVARAGQAALSFDGTADSVAGSFGATLPAPLTIYIVAEHVTTGARWIYDGITSGERAFLLSTTGPPSVYRIGGPIMAVTSAVTAPVGAIHAHCGVYNSASSAAYLLSNFSVAAATGDTGVAALTGLTVGSIFGGATNFFHGFAWEAIVYSGAHNAANRKLIGDYFTARYTGLTVTT